MSECATTEVQFAELFDLVAGKKLGYGAYRTVYEFAPDPTLVVKAANCNSEANWIEFRVWSELRETRFAKYLAPCVRISDCGLYLLQKRVERRPKADYPKLVPAFFVDLKCSNYGWIGKQFVCCDYGSMSITSGVNARMKRVEWRDA